MRVKRLATFVVLGIAIALAYGVRRRRGRPARRAVPSRVDARGAAAELDESKLWRGDQAGDLLDEELAGWDAAPPSGLDFDVTGPTADEDLGADAGIWVGDRALDLTEDEDPHAGQHETATTGTPAADRGSRGPRGL